MSKSPELLSTFSSTEIPNGRNRDLILSQISNAKSVVDRLKLQFAKIIKNSSITVPAERMGDDGFVAETLRPFLDALTLSNPDEWRDLGFVVAIITPCHEGLVLNNKNLYDFLKQDTNTTGNFLALVNECLHIQDLTKRQDGEGLTNYVFSQDEIYKDYPDLAVFRYQQMSELVIALLNWNSLDQRLKDSIKAVFPKCDTYREIFENHRRNFFDLYAGGSINDILDTRNIGSTTEALLPKDPYEVRSIYRRAIKSTRIPSVILSNYLAERGAGYKSPDKYWTNNNIFEGITSPSDTSIPDVNTIKRSLQRFSHTRSNDSEFEIDIKNTLSDFFLKTPVSITFGYDTRNAHTVSVNVSWHRNNNQILNPIKDHEGNIRNDIPIETFSFSIKFGNKNTPDSFDWSLMEDPDSDNYKWLKDVCYKLLGEAMEQYKTNLEDEKRAERFTTSQKPDRPKDKVNVQETVERGTFTSIVKIAAEEIIGGRQAHSDYERKVHEVLVKLNQSLGTLDITHNTLSDTYDFMFEGFKFVCVLSDHNENTLVVTRVTKNGN